MALFHVVKTRKYHGIELLSVFSLLFREESVPPRFTSLGGALIIIKAFLWLGLPFSRAFFFCKSVKTYSMLEENRRDIAISASSTPTFLRLENSCAVALNWWFNSCSLTERSVSI